MFIHTLASMLIAKAIILGPLERMKIILQVNSLANFANPSDRPQGALDLSNSKPHIKKSIDNRNQHKPRYISVLQGE
jgi:hypothetical protein